MKCKWISVCALSALLSGMLLLSGCGGGSTDQPSVTESEAPAESSLDRDTAAVTDPESVQPETGGSETAQETETAQVTETEPELPLADMQLTAKALSAEDGGVTLDFLVAIVDAPAQSRVVRLVLSDAEGEITSRELTSLGDDMSETLPCPADRLGGELTLTVTAVVDGNVVTDELVLKMKNRLPQLTPDGVRCVVDAMTDEEKADLVVGYYEVGVKYGMSGGTIPIERLGVPGTLCMDGPAGIRYNESVWYPSVINVSSSWDPELATRVGVALGQDALAQGFDVVLAPGINIQKNVLGGRNFEYSSEDPLLSGLMIAPYVNGIQSTGAGTSLKHFAANNQETARSSVSANVTERALREIYLKAFGIVVNDAQPMTIMSSYNRINGTYTAANRDLLVGILREEFGFQGMVMSDWGASGSMVEKVNAMNDMNMPGDDGDAEAVLAGLSSGAITEQALDACCYNILTMVTRSATFKGLEMNTGVNFRDNGKVATEAATDGMVLLQNENAALPLGEGSKVAVFGNGAFATVYGGAGSGGVNARQVTSIIDGLAKQDGLTVVNKSKSENPFFGCEAHDAADPSKDVEVTEAYAKEMAAAADVAVIVISRGSSEGEDRKSLKGDFLLNDTEAAMVERLSKAFRAAGKKVVVLLNTGSPIEVESWKEQVDAILWIGYPGQGAGTAVARVLIGEVNPSGKTTITWPTTYVSTPGATSFPGSANNVTYYEDIYVGYRYYSTFDVDVAYPFGYGLSYTTFGYSDFTLTENQDGTVTAKVTVKNTGKVAGREVVQLYVSKPETLHEQAAVELCGFAKTALLEPGQSETVTIQVRMDALKTYDTENSRWVLDKGTYTYQIGFSVASLFSKKTVTVGDVRVIQDVENRCEPLSTFEIIQKATYKVPGSEGAKVNLALNRPITSNYDEGSYLPEFAVDGDYITRWSGFGIPAELGDNLLTVDLGEEYAIGACKIIWESIHAPFSVQYSVDGQNFTTFDTYLDDGSMRTSINLFGAKARYVRIKITQSTGYVSIFELELFEATEADIEAGKNHEAEKPRTNVAVGKPVTASSVEGSYVASNATDGDMVTRWGSQPSGEGWLIVDLEETVKITGVHVILEAAWVPYVVEYSVDGETYTTLHEAIKDELLVKKLDLDIEARYIRVRRDGENWFSIYELMVYND